MDSKFGENFVLVMAATGGLTPRRSPGAGSGRALLETPGGNRRKSHVPGAKTENHQSNEGNR
jgi:hypothetical protein